MEFDSLKTISCLLINVVDSSKISPKRLLCKFVTSWSSKVITAILLACIAYSCVYCIVQINVEKWSVYS